MTFESVIGYSQPANTGTMVVITTDARGVSYDRGVARVDTMLTQKRKGPRRLAVAP